MRSMSAKPMASSYRSYLIGSFSNVEYVFEADHYSTVQYSRVCIVSRELIKM